MKTGVHAQRLILLALALCLATLPVWAEKRALLVGINDYIYSDAILLDLRGCENDALLIKKALIGSFGFRAENIRVLLSREATASRIRDEFKSFLIDQSKPGDWIVFSFSGHGTQLRTDMPPLDEVDDHKDEVLVTADTDPKKGPVIVDDELNVLLSQLKGRTVLVLLDCCHSGTATRGFTPGTRGARRLNSLCSVRSARMPGLQAAAARGLPADIAMSHDAIVLTAASDRQEAMDATFLLPNGEQRSQGAFTHYLIEGILGPADGDGSGTLSMNEVFSYARSALKKNSFAQDPQFDVPQGRGLEDVTFFGEDSLPPGRMNVAKVQDPKKEMAETRIEIDETEAQMAQLQATVQMQKAAEKAARQAKEALGDAESASKRASDAEAAARSAAEKARKEAETAQEAADLVKQARDEAVTVLDGLVNEAQEAGGKAAEAAERASEAANRAKLPAQARSAAARSASELGAIGRAAEEADKREAEARLTYDLAAQKVEAAEREREGIQKEAQAAFGKQKQLIADVESDAGALAEARKEQERLHAAKLDAESRVEKALAALEKAEAEVDGASLRLDGVKGLVAAAEEAAREAAAVAATAQKAAETAQNRAAGLALPVAGIETTGAERAAEDAAAAAERAQKAAGEARQAAQQVAAIRDGYRKSKKAGVTPTDAQAAAENALDNSVAAGQKASDHAAAAAKTAERQSVSAKGQVASVKAAAELAKAAKTEAKSIVASRAAAAGAASEKAAASTLTAQKAASQAAAEFQGLNGALAEARRMAAASQSEKAEAEKAGAEAVAAAKASDAQVAAAQAAATRTAASVEKAKAEVARVQAEVKNAQAALAEAKKAETRAAIERETAESEREKLRIQLAEAKELADEAALEEQAERERLASAEAEQARLEQAAAAAAERERLRLAEADAQRQRIAAEEEATVKLAQETARIQREEEGARKKAEEERQRLIAEAIAVAAAETARLEQLAQAEKVELAAAQQAQQDQGKVDEAEGVQAEAVEQGEKEEIAASEALEETQKLAAEKEEVLPAASDALADAGQQVAEEEEDTAAELGQQEEAKLKQEEALAALEQLGDHVQVTLPMGAQAGVLVGSIFAAFPPNGSADRPSGKVRITDVSDNESVGEVIEGTVLDTNSLQCVFEPAVVRNLQVSVEGSGPAYAALLDTVKSLPNVELKEDYEADRRLLALDNGEVEILNQWGDAVLPPMRADSISDLAQDVKNQLTMTYFGRQLADMSNPKPAFSLDLKTLPEGTAVLGRHDPVSFEVRCVQDARIVILYKDSAGDVDMLFPNAYERDNVVRAGQPRIFPDPGGDIEIVADNPTGEVLYKVFAFALGQNVEAEFQEEYTGERELKQLTERLRELLFRPDAKIDWAEASAVQEYRW